MFSQIGGIDWNQPEDVILGQLERAIPLSEIEATAASMPAVDPRNDVTKMTMGETERMIWEDRMRILSNLFEELCPDRSVYRCSPCDPAR